MKKDAEMVAPGIRNPEIAGYIVASMGFYRFPPDCPFYSKSKTNRDLWYRGFDSHPKWGGKVH